MHRHRNHTIRRQAENPPSSKEGHLYYVRLRTPVGLLYKIGFTTMISVHARLSFSGDGAELLIDKTILFEHFKDAWDFEQYLHKLHKKKAAFCGWEDGMPLLLNGQSELYCEDVLELDSDYSYRQAQHSQDEITIARHISSGADETLLREGMRKRRERQWDNQLHRIKENPDAIAKKGWTWAIISVVGAVVGALLSAIFILGFAVLKLFNKVNETENDRRLTQLRITLKNKARN